MKTLFSFLIFFFFFFFIFTTLTCGRIIVKPSSTLNSPPPHPNEPNECDKFVCDDNWNHAKTDKSYRLGPPLLDSPYVIDVKLESTVPDQPCPRNGVLVDEEIEAHGQKLGDYFTITPTVTTEDGRIPMETPFAISTVKKNDLCNEEDRHLRMTRRNKKVKFWHMTGDGEFNTSASCFQFVNYPVPSDPGYLPTYVLQNCPLV